MIKIEAIVKAVPGDMVMVRNYRKSGDQYEIGEVRSTEISVHKDGTHSVHYHVWVNRVPKHPRGKYGYYLSVGPQHIYKTESHEKTES